MDLLIVEPLEPEVMHWLVARHAVRYAPELARDPRAFRQALFNVRALIMPPSVALDARRCITRRCCARSAASARAPRTSTSMPARAPASRWCAAPTASAAAEAEFMIGALLAMLRRVPVVAPTACWSGRELGGATVGLIGMTPAARVVAQLLARLRLARGRLRPGGARLATACGTAGTWSRWACAS